MAGSGKVLDRRSGAHLLRLGEPPVRARPHEPIVRRCGIIARKLAVAGGAGVGPHHDDAVEPDMAQPEKSDCRRHLIPGGPTPPDQEKAGIGKPADQGSVGTRQHRRRVDDIDIIGLPRLFEQCGDPPEWRRSRKSSSLGAAM
jgi:hypothetical protein